MLKDAAADLILVMEHYHRLWLGVGVPDFPDHVSIADHAGVAMRVHLFTDMFGSQAEDDVICRENPTIEDILVAAENLEELLKRTPDVPRIRELLGSKT